MHTGTTGTTHTHYLEDRTRYIQQSTSTHTQHFHNTQQQNNNHTQKYCKLFIQTREPFFRPVCNYKLLIQKLYNTTQDITLCSVIQNLLSDRRLYVELNNECNRWRKQKKGLLQGSVHAPTLVNVYTNDQLIHDGT